MPGPDPPVTDDDDERLDALERRVRELEAATRALRGYVGDRRAVAASVERRADAALAAVDRLEDDEPDES